MGKDSRFLSRYIDWFKNSKVGKFFGLGGEDDEDKIKKGTSISSLMKVMIDR